MPDRRFDRKKSFIVLGFALLCATLGAHAASSDDVVLQALSLLGTPYRYGGSSPTTGFDCSGLVRHVFAQAAKQELPRRSEDMQRIGRPVTRSELRPGDLVFFNTLRRAFSHVAIYIGDGRFVHAPAGSGFVRIEALEDRYWLARFDGARRVTESGTDVSPAGPLQPRSPASKAPDEVIRP